MKYDFSQEAANEMLVRADANNDALTSKIVALESELSALRTAARDVLEHFIKDPESGFWKHNPNQYMRHRDDALDALAARLDGQE